jgi:exosortase
MSISVVSSAPASSRPAARPLALGLVVAGAVVVLAHLPLLVQHGRQLWLRPHYQFFPLVLLGSLVLAFLRLRDGERLAPGSPRWSWPLLALAWFVLVLAELLYSSWLAAVAALALLAAALFTLGGGRLLRAALPAWLLLWLAVPPPFELDRSLILGLQSLTARWSSSALDVLGVLHVMAGNVVESSGRRLLVEEACSGVNSLFSVLACTVFFVLLARRPFPWSLTLIAAAIAWVLAANVARVVFVTYASVRWGIDLTSGWRHDALGLLLFALALVLLASTDQLLQFLLKPATPGRPKHEPAVAAAETATGCGLPWGVAGGLSAAYALLLAGHLSLYGIGREAGVVTAPGPVAAAVDGLDADTLPERCEHWQRLGFAHETRNLGSAFGERSVTWTYHLGQNAGAVSLDYSFPGWHDLTRCYTGQGWRIEGEVVQEAAPEGYVEVQLTKPAYRSGYLLYCQFDEQGVPLEPRRGGSHLSVHRHESALRHFWERVSPTATPLGGDPPGPVYQLQLFVESYAPLSLPEQHAARELFLRARHDLRERCLGEAAKVTLHSNALQPQLR